MIALIGCVKSKAKTKCMAKDMYISPLFKMSYKYAKTITDDIYTFRKIWSYKRYNCNKPI